MAEVATINVPQADFVTSTLNGAITNSSTSFTIGSGLLLDPNGGFLQIDYDSLVAVGVDTGPETIAYTSYNTGTGLVSGVTRAQAQTTAVAHNNGTTVQCGMSSKYLLNGNVLGTASASGQSGVTTVADVTGATVTVIVPAGGRSVKVTAVASGSSNNAAGLTSFDIQAAGSNMTGGNFRITHNNATNSFTAMGFAVETPAAGSRTYKLRVTGVVGTSAVDAALTHLLVELA